MNASLNIRDCSSMYCSERVLLASRYCRRLCIDLKKDSWVDGTAGFGCVDEGRGGDGADEFAAVLLLGGLATEPFAGGDAPSGPRETDPGFLLIEDAPDPVTDPVGALI